MLEKIQKSKQELQEQYEQNNAVINKYNKYIRILNVNTFENKFQFFFLMSGFIYSIPMLIMTFLRYPSVFGLSPFVSFPLVSIGSSLIVSSIISYNVFKKNKLALNKVTSAKTQEEILLEKTKYEIEVEKINSKNKAIKKSLESLSKEENRLNNISRNSEGIAKQMPQLEIQRDIDSIDKTLNNKEEDVNLLTTQNYLVDRFTNVRSKISSFYNYSIPTMMVSIISLLLLTLPIVFGGMFNEFSLYYPNVNPNSYVVASIFTPLALSITGSTLYFKNLSSKEKKVFRKINGSLIENAISEKEQTDEEKIEGKLNSKISELSRTILEKIRIKRALESNDTRSEEIEQSIEKPFKIMNMPNLELNLGEEKHGEKEGPTLVKRI